MGYSMIIVILILDLLICNASSGRTAISLSIIEIWLYIFSIFSISMDYLPLQFVMPINPIAHFYNGYNGYNHLQTKKESLRKMKSGSNG